MQMTLNLTPVSSYDAILAWLMMIWNVEYQHSLCPEGWFENQPIL